MRRIVVAALSTVSALVMLFSYHTSTQGGTAVASGTGSSGGTGPSGGTGSSGSASGSSGSSSSGSSSGTFTGDTVQTRWGPVQVEIEVKDGKITASQAVVYPQDNPRDVEINDYALPVLNQAVVDAQSAQIDTVSGATVTSDGYIRSLQSALDAAHL